MILIGVLLVFGGVVSIGWSCGCDDGADAIIMVALGWILMLCALYSFAAAS